MLHGSDENSVGLPRDMSHHMLEKYDGQITTSKDGIYTKEAGGVEIVNIPLDTRLNRNYGNVINSFEKENKASDARIGLMVGPLDGLSDQTLYDQQKTGDGSASKRESVIKIMRQATLQ